MRSRKEFNNGNDGTEWEGDLVEWNLNWVGFGFGVLLGVSCGAVFGAVVLIFLDCFGFRFPAGAVSFCWDSWFCFGVLFFVRWCFAFSGGLLLFPWLCCLVKLQRQGQLYSLCRRCLRLVYVGCSPLLLCFAVWLLWPVNKVCLSKKKTKNLK